MSEGTFNIDELKERAQSGNVIFRSKTVLTLIGIIEQLIYDADRYEQALHEIDTWAKAYPLDVFPEPDFKRVREVLTAAGISLDEVSASNMRHVIKGTIAIVTKALKGGEG